MVVNIGELGISILLHPHVNLTLRIFMQAEFHRVYTVKFWSTDNPSRSSQWNHIVCTLVIIVSHCDYILWVDHPIGCTILVVDHFGWFSG